MKKRICPICDGEIKIGHFCPQCHEWVRNPVVMEVNYYLNERRPRTETERLYREGREGLEKRQGGGKNPLETQKRQGKAAPVKSASARKVSVNPGSGKDVPGRQSPAKTAPARGGLPVEYGTKGAGRVRPSGKRTNGGWAVLIVFIVYLLIMFIAPMLRILMSLFF